MVIDAAATRLCLSAVRNITVSLTAVITGPIKITQFDLIFFVNNVHNIVHLQFSSVSKKYLFRTIHNKKLVKNMSKFDNPQL